MWKIKQKNNQPGKITKGGTSGFLISLAIHAILFFLAGLLIVFTVQKKEEKKFVPPAPVDRPKMQLKKPKVKVKQSAKPKPTQRIVTKMKSASMPDIQLPELSGVSDGLNTGIGGFDLMPNLNETTLFGGGQTIGNDFAGTFYDFKRDRMGRPIPMDPTQFTSELRRFVRDGFRTTRLAQFYRSPKKLFATAFMIPPVRSSVAPNAFGESETGGWCWMAHYKGPLVYHEDIKIRFWGNGDDVLVVAVDGEIVLSACWPDGDWGNWGISAIGGDWRSDAKNNFRFYLGNNLSRIGDWIELKAGVPRQMDIMIGEVPGGAFSAMLTVEVEGEDYPKNRQGGPILPMFKTDEPSLNLIDEIYKNLVPDEAAVTNGPIFRDYDFIASKKVKDEIYLEEKVSEYRLWKFINGQEIEAKYISTIGDRVVLKRVDGKQRKVPLKDLSEIDKEYIDLSIPPPYSINFIKTSSVRSIKTTPFLDEEPPRVNDLTFGVRVKQSNSKQYNHEITVEYFAIGQELIGDNYILVDRQKSRFIPSKENGFSHSFNGEPIEFMEYVYDGDRRGKKYVANVVVMYDKLGRIMHYSASNEWMFEQLDKLKKIPVGRYFNNMCERVIPTSPKAQRY